MEPRPDVHGLSAETPRRTRDADRDARVALVYGLIASGIPASIVLRGTFEPIARIFDWMPPVFAVNQEIVWFAMILVSGVAAIRVGRRARRGGTRLRRARVAIVLGVLGIIAGVLGAAAFALLVIAMRNFQF